jgi:hypothetical protein
MTMTRAEAYRIARATIATAFDLERVIVSDKPRMVPKNRRPNGTALKSEDQEAADAYNWFSDAPVEDRFR